eukprot:CAMPEP_0117435680 /NCGR_PEP_ID=MMETSP0759-20121206/606_1 /TAXON_ID=63605 /ORGANISM="Percolomonas cosmopolitus, Strain WS" /LENGTH=467 /DNA_ID=CAMNT_0005227235 /DNA_START=73 /DNA_END=1476 /DNA_ORIENTATION=+
MSYSTTSTQFHTQHIQSLARQVLPLGQKRDLQQIVNDIPDSARVVLIGEQSHGTADYYAIRAELSKMLIQQKGFNAIATEADWPDALEVNKYWRGHKKGANHALGEFSRWPRWMWRNKVVLQFVDWLKEHNSQFSDPKEFVNFFGLDMYSLQSSRDAVVNYLEKVDPELAQKARKSYACFDRFGESDQSYGYAMSLGFNKSCEDSVLKVIRELHENQGRLVDEAKEGDDAHFYALQNAKVVKDAENYYRHMFASNVSTWNIRDEHMADCLCDLIKYKKKVQNKNAKVIVWAHNSHLSGVSLQKGEWNLGELCRKRFPGEESYIALFTSHTGTVTAAHQWDSPPQCMRVNPSLENSYERLFHEVVKEAGTNQLPHKRFILLMSKIDKETKKFLSEKRLERAIGVIYAAKTEFWSHYVNVRLTEQCDALIHVDHSHALIPLEIKPQWKQQHDKHHQHLDDVPETFPFGL